MCVYLLFFLSVVCFVHVTMHSKIIFIFGHLSLISSHQLLSMDSNYRQIFLLYVLIIVTIHVTCVQITIPIYVCFRSQVTLYVDSKPKGFIISVFLHEQNCVLYSCVLVNFVVVIRCAVATAVLWSPHPLCSSFFIQKAFVRFIGTHSSASY